MLIYLEITSPSVLTLESKLLSSAVSCLFVNDVIALGYKDEAAQPSDR